MITVDLMKENSMVRILEGISTTYQHRRLIVTSNKVVCYRFRINCHSFSLAIKDVYLSKKK